MMAVNLFKITNILQFVIVSFRNYNVNKHFARVYCVCNIYGVFLVGILGSAFFYVKSDIM